MINPPLNAGPQAAMHQSPPVPFCYGPCCNGFLRQEHLANIPPPNLTDFIHPCFEQHAFQNIQGEIRYEYLRQPLLLATQLISATLPFFHTLLFGKIRRLAQKGKKGEDWYEIEGQDESTLTAEQLDETRDALYRLDEYISFSVDDEGQFETNAIDPIEDDDFFRGYRSEIALSTHRLYDLQQAYNNQLDAFKTTWYTWHSAISIAHEFVHAVAYARYPFLHNTNDLEADKLFFKGSEVAEEGYEWEKFAFGGIVLPMHGMNSIAHRPANFYIADGAPVVFENMLVMEDYPNISWVRLYETEGFSIAQRGYLPDISVFWNVDFLCLAQMLQDKYWKQIVPALGRQVMHFPRTTGYRFRNSQAGNARPYGAAVFDKQNPNQFLGWDFDTAVPQGYSVNDGGLVRVAEDVEMAEPEEMQVGELMHYDGPSYGQTL